MRLLGYASYSFRSRESSPATEPKAPAGEPNPAADWEKPERLFPGVPVVPPASETEKLLDLMFR